MKDPGKKKNFEILIIRIASNHGKKCNWKKEKDHKWGRPKDKMHKEEITIN